MTTLSERFKAAAAALGFGKIENNASIASGVYGSEIYNLMSGLSGSGAAVNERTAMSVSAVYSCVNLIGGALASLPLHIYQRTTDGRERAPDSPLWWLLNEEPSPGWSAAVFWEWMASSLLLNGDAFAKIIRPGPKSPQVIGFEPVHRSRVVITQAKNGLKYYTIAPDPRVGGQQETLEQSDVFHIPGPGFDGFRGMSQVLYVLRNPAGIALAADEYSARFFKNGARPDFAIEVAGTVTKEQQEMLRRTWADRHSGVENSHLPALMVGGAKVHELTMNAEDAQLIATRQFQVEDVARIFGVPPHMIGHSGATSWGTGIEQMGIAFVKYTLQRHLVKFEQEINRKLWPSRTKYFVEFNTSGLERGDYKSRNEGYRIALGRAGEPAWLTVNEVRKFENLGPVTGGDKVATNEPAAPPAAPAPDPAKEKAAEQAAQKAAARDDAYFALANRETPAPTINVAAPAITVALNTDDFAAIAERTTEAIGEQARGILASIREDVQNMPVIIPAPVVNVTAPNIDVHFEATLPEQAAPTVNIINEVPAVSEMRIVGMPARVTTSKVERDGDGNITRTTQAETDA